jgi:hypothetical protein
MTDAPAGPSRAPGPNRLLCPFCGSPVEVRAAKRRRPELRRCPHCEAELRDAGDGLWRLEYVHPDWLPHMRRDVEDATRARLGPVLLQTASWEDWPLVARGERGPGPVEATGRPAAAAGGRSGEKLLSGYARARVVLAATHHAWHTWGPVGTLWLSDGSLAFDTGEYEWRVPLADIRGVRDAGGMLEILWGPTEEPLFVALDGSASAADSVDRACADARTRAGSGGRPASTSNP